MKASRRWLCDFTAAAGAADSALLTARGLEVESETPFASATGVVAAEIKTAAPHPRADLKICGVAGGGRDLATVVCGAPNAAVGMRVAYAPPGARLGAVEIGARSIRGVESAGMICSAAELGLEPESAGVLDLGRETRHLRAGEAVDDLLGLNDSILDLSITPNRGDWLSHLGVAREWVGAQGETLPAWSGGDSALDDDGERMTVKIAPAARRACPFFGCVIVRGVDLSRPTPAAIASRLLRCGMRPINAAVDITNYVMLECGQPLHAFDLAKIESGIVVRFAHAGESIDLLNGQTVSLRPDCLVVADGKKPVALAGVMGGADSAITTGSRDILLEAAHFSPFAVRGQMRRRGIESEAGFRFERGVDWTLPPKALARAAGLLTAVAGGQAQALSTGGKIPRARREIVFDFARVAKVVGVEIPFAQAARELATAGIEARRRGKAKIAVAPPPHRFDIEIAADAIGEIARLRGYENLPATTPAGARAAPRRAPRPFAADGLRAFLAARGYREIVTYPFIDDGAEGKLHGGRGVALKNPIAETMSVMRSSLIAGLIDRARFNFHHGIEAARLFEFGRCFFRPPQTNGAPKLDDFSQPHKIAALAAGPAAPTQWATPARAVDFYDLKGDLEEMLAAPGGRLRVRFAALPDHPALHPGRAAEALVALPPTADGGASEEVSLGFVGELHPRFREEYKIPAAALFEIDADRLAAIESRPPIAPVSRFPAARRDIALLVDRQRPAAEMLTRARAALADCDDFAATADLFDCFADDSLGADKKSVGVRLRFQGRERNLTEDQLNAAVAAVAQALEAAGAARRES